MEQSTMVEVLLQGGPADGAFRWVQSGPDGRPPELLMFSGGTLYVGATDEPAPARYPTYELDPQSIDAVLWMYRYVETLTV